MDSCHSRKDFLAVNGLRAPWCSRKTAVGRPLSTVRLRRPAVVTCTNEHALLRWKILYRKLPLV